MMISVSPRKHRAVEVCVCYCQTDWWWLVWVLGNIELWKCVYVTVRLMMISVSPRKHRAVEVCVCYCQTDWWWLVWVLGNIELWKCVYVTVRLTDDEKQSCGSVCMLLSDWLMISVSPRKHRAVEVCVCYCQTDWWLVWVLGNIELWKCVYVTVRLTDDD